MTTPFRRHQERVRKQQQAEAARAAIAEQRAPEPQADAAETMAALLVNLEQDVARLSGKTVDEKTAIKAEILPGYLEAARAYLASGEQYANPVLVRVIIWLFDLIEQGHAAGDILAAEELALAAIEQAQQMPENFKRDLPTYVSDAFLAWAKLEIDQNHSPEPIFSRVFEQVKTWPVPRVVLMKYHKAAAAVAIDAGDDVTGVAHLFAAQKLGTTDHPAKVSTALKNAKKRLEKQGIALPGETPKQDAAAKDEPATDGQPEHPADDAATESSDASQ